MTLPHLAVGTIVSLLATFFLRGKLRGFFLLTFSVLAVYALQPALPIRYLDFWLPTATLGLTLLGWVAITPRENLFARPNLLAAAWMFTLAAALTLTRYLTIPLPLTASPPPGAEKALFGLATLAAGAFLLGYAPKRTAQRLGLGSLLGLLILLKSPQASLWVAQALRALNAQDVASASGFDIRWIGFSYIAFRLIHTLQDTQKGRGAAVSLAEYVTFVFFFPTLTAGPIDRLERFAKDLRAPLPPDWDFVIQRMTLGLLKKFILADSLALMALNPQNAAQVTSAPWAWVLLYGYALQIYLDFSGYTDLALALARLAGVALPENFNQPYAKPNLTLFWNNWHMSLTQWFRAYTFNPLTRTLRATALPAWGIILLTQLATMTLIGLWHGVTLNFVVWGLWHGLGLFLHNRWQDTFRGRVNAWAQTPARQRFAAWGGAALTFQFVSLGWVWFALPTPQMALSFFKTLVGG